MTASKFKQSLLSAGAALAITAFSGGAAEAGYGMLPTCWGVASCGMGGAGAALGTDASSAILNPALGAKVGNNAQISVGFLNANVDAKVRGALANSSVNPDFSSKAETFADGSLAVNYQITPKWTVNLALFPGGGGATNYPFSRTNAGQNRGGQDSFIRLRMFQAELSVAHKYSDKLAVGVGLIYSRQDLKTDSLNNVFASASQGPVGSLEKMNGGGFQIGGVWTPDPRVNIALSYRSRIWHEATNTYENIFNGAIDIPQIWTLATAVKATPNTDVVFDVRTIPWSGVKSIGASPQNYGGFGWKNQIVVNAGVQQKIRNLTLRAGWAYGNSPINENNVFANVLLPAIVEHHFMAGASYKFMGNYEVGFSGYFAPKVTVKDDGSGDSFSQNGKGTELSHEQFGGQVSFSVDF